VWEVYGDSASAFDGIGYVFSSGCPFVGFDLDGVRDREIGAIDEKTLRYLEGFEDAYIEVSPRGTGVHLITRAKLPKAVRTGDRELYDMGRHFAITGRSIYA